MPLPLQFDMNRKATSMALLALALPVMHACTLVTGRCPTSTEAAALGPVIGLVDLTVAVARGGCSRGDEDEQ